MTWRTLVAASALVTDGDRLLLIRQVRGGVSSWELPGGYLDAGESLEQAAAREAREEAGLDVVVGRLAFTLTWHNPSQERSNIITVFEAVPAAADWVLAPQLDEGIDAVEFVRREDLVIESLNQMYQEPVRAWLQAPAGSPPALWVCDYAPDGTGTMRAALLQ